MNIGKTKKLLIMLLALVMIAASSGCDKITSSEQTTPTLAPLDDAALTPDPETGETPEPTATPNPLEIFNYWSVEPDKNIYNILLLGLDELDGTMWARNDTTMILQINLETNQMKLVSFMRDMYVEIPGHEKARLNESYYRGGPELAKRTMKSVFDVDIDHYAVVDFITFEQIMLIIGPIMVRIMDYEVEHLKIVESAVSIDGEQIKGQGMIQYAGVQPLNAYQALSLARDRRSSGENNERSGDKGRNERQREIIKAAWVKVKTKHLAAVPAAVLGAEVYLDTDMEPGLIITLLKRMLDSDAQIEDMAIPQGKHWELRLDRENGLEYNNDAFEALYYSEKEQYEQEQLDALAPDVTQSPGDGEQTPAPAAATPAAIVPFKSYKQWEVDKGFPSVIDWNRRQNLYALHEFLGIN